MPQIFHHSTNFLAKLSIFGSIFILLAAVWAVAEVNRSSWNTGQWVERQQPVQFSLRRVFQQCWHAANQDLHELPFADLG